MAVYKQTINSFADWMALTAKVAKRFSQTDKPFYISISPNHKRSNAQNRYLWSVVYKTIAEPESYTTKGERVTDDHVHELCKKAFLNKSDGISMFGLFVEWTGSTTKLTTIEFQDYVLKITAHFAEHGIIIPEPNEDIYENCEKN